MLKRTPLLLTLAVMVAVVGGYLLYERVLNREPLQPWNLVPENALFVYEKDVCNTCIDAVRQTAFWELVHAAALYGRPLDTLHTQLERLLADSRDMLISAHITRKDDFDVVYYLTAPALDELVAGLSALKDYRYSERQFNDVRIHELSRDGQTFSWIAVRDIWVASFTPFLVEDVVRTYHGKPGFEVRHGHVRRLPRISGDAGNLFVRLGALPDWLGVFLPRTDQLQVVGGATVLDVKTTEENVVLNGFSTASQGGHLLSLFNSQSPVALGLRNYISNRAVAVKSYGINDGAAFSRSLAQYVTQYRPGLRDSLRRMVAGIPFDLQKLHASISDEIVVCEVEGITQSGLARIVMVETDAPEEWISQLGALAEKTSEDTVFYEHFSDHVIREVPVSGFVPQLLWPLVDGFPRTYYCANGNTLFLSDHLEELKRFLEDIEHEDTWGKSVSRNQFLEATLLESNVSLYVNVSRVWNILTPRLNDRWKKFVNDRRQLLRKLEMTAFQFSHLNNTYYTNITLQEGEGLSGAVFTASSGSNRAHFPAPLQRVHVVRSHVSPENELLVQDSLNDIRLVSMDGQVMWKLAIGDQIRGEIQQIDYYNNGKLQYIFATRDAIHIVDRLGNYVPSYPLHLEGQHIRHLVVVDYDRSKRYRFLVTGDDGSLRMYDKAGNNLEGWTPREVGHGLFAPARHHRIRGRDFIIAIRRDGLVHLYNRRGEMMKGFPLDLQGTPMGDYYLETGGTVADSWFVVVTRDGYRIRFNAEGRILHRETLLRAYVGSQFSLIPEKSRKTYLIVQHDRRQMTVSDADARRLVSGSYVDPDDGGVQYYQFAGGRRFICLTDRVQRMAYVYNGTGQLLTAPPLEGSAMALSMSNSDASYVFFIHGNALTIQPLVP